MLKIEKVVLPSAEQWEAIIRGMRNPKNSWGLSDSGMYCEDQYDGYIEPIRWKVGPNDHKLMTSLAKGGPVHAKYRRMIPVFLDITAPLYWWKEFDTYKIGTVANSCSTMHKIQAKEFTLDDFSHDQLLSDFSDDICKEFEDVRGYLNSPIDDLKYDIEKLNMYRELYLRTGDKKYWWQMIQRLLSSYNQKRTVMLNYEVLHNIYISRKNHKLDEWHVVCDWIESLPYSELITGRDKEMEAKALERYKTIYEKIKNHGLPEVKEFTSWIKAALETKEK